MQCRFCKNNLSEVFIDLGESPLSNSFLTKEDLNLQEKYYPLKVYVCTSCFLVQTGEEKKPEEIFNEKYVYYSSYSVSWLRHAEEYVKMMIKRFGYNEKSFVIEVASNDGYLLQYFQKENIPVLGIEPSGGTAEVAQMKGINTRVEYFGKENAEWMAKQNIKADLLIGNNVLAHVPDINDFAEGLRIILKDDGIITMEFPHLMQLVINNQFDTIYHEHFFYYSLSTVSTILKKHGLEIFDVEQLDTHGGSLRIFANNVNSSKYGISENVFNLLERENNLRMSTPGFYRSFQKAAEEVKENFVEFLRQKKKENKKIAGYGAAAKGNTLLNYCGAGTDLIEYIVDVSPYKQGKYLPGTHIPVFAESIFNEDRPDYIVILPWNIKEEIINQLSYVRDWGAKFIVPIPSLEIIN